MPRSSRRSYGRGSVYRRSSDGRWVATLPLGGRRLTRYARSEKEARAALALLRQEAQAGTLTPPTPLTLAAWVAQDLALQATTLRPSTLRTYRQVLAPLLALLGTVRLHRLTPAQLATALVALRQRGMGSRRLQLARACLSASLQRAVTLGVLPRNPAARVPRPQHAPRERPVWGVAEMRRFLAVARASRRQHAPLLVFLLGTGCRFSEACGLRWHDLDLAAGTARIERAVVWTGNATWTVEQPKTRAGLRTLSLPPFVVATLRGLPRPLADEAWVFTSRTGTPPTPSAVLKTLTALCQEAEVPVVTVHGLRHSHASVLVASGVPLKEAQRRLGHARASVTLDIYSHALVPDAQAAAAVERALGCVGRRSEAHLPRTARAGLLPQPTERPARERSTTP